MEQVLEAGHKRIMKFFSQVKVVEIPAAELLPLDPQEKSFCNINTPEEYYRLRSLPFDDELQKETSLSPLRRA
jgi:molybdopterin-guanine dinucleotide biosynthesis protein A